VREMQNQDEKFVQIMNEVEGGKSKGYIKREYGTMMLRGRLCVSNVESLRKEIMEEAYNAAYSLYPGSTKMYRTLEEIYWWLGMKKDVAEYVSKCLVCQQVKVEHQCPIGKLQPLPIP